MSKITLMDLEKMCASVFVYRLKEYVPLVLNEQEEAELTKVVIDKYLSLHRVSVQSFFFEAMRSMNFVKEALEAIDKKGELPTIRFISKEKVFNNDEKIMRSRTEDDVYALLKEDLRVLREEFQNFSNVDKAFFLNASVIASKGVLFEGEVFEKIYKYQDLLLKAQNPLDEWVEKRPLKLNVAIERYKDNDNDYMNQFKEAIYKHLKKKNPNKRMEVHRAIDSVRSDFEWGVRRWNYDQNLLEELKSSYFSDNAYLNIQDIQKIFCNLSNIEDAGTQREIQRLFVGISVLDFYVKNRTETDKEKDADVAFGYMKLDIGRETDKAIDLLLNGVIEKDNKTNEILLSNYLNNLPSEYAEKVLKKYQEVVLLQEGKGWKDYLNVQEEDVKLFVLDLNKSITMLRLSGINYATGEYVKMVSSTSSNKLNIFITGEYASKIELKDVMEIISAAQNQVTEEKATLQYGDILDSQLRAHMLNKDVKKSANKGINKI